MIKIITLHFDNAIEGAVVRGAAESSGLYHGYLSSLESTGVKVEIIQRVGNPPIPMTQFVKDVLKFIRKVKYVKTDERKEV